MGLQVDLTKMLGVPEKIMCPKCEEIAKTRFDDYDLECGNPNPDQQRWELDFYCEHCGHEATISYFVSVETP